MRMQTDDILILANNNFACIEKDTIKSAKIMTKNRKYLISTHFIKFYNAQIQFNSNGIVLTIKSHLGELF